MFQFLVHLGRARAHSLIQGIDSTLRSSIELVLGVYTTAKF